MKTLRQKLEEIDEECRDCPPELSEAALGVIRLKVAKALEDVAKLEVYASILETTMKRKGEL
jgi:hypothetical protein